VGGRNALTKYGYNSLSFAKVNPDMTSRNNGPSVTVSTGLLPDAGLMIAHVGLQAPKRPCTSLELALRPYENAHAPTRIVHPCKLLDIRLGYLGFV
jgi:hypothetical protein